MEKNAIRECIKAFFPRRDCACLVRPTNEESELQVRMMISQIDEFLIFDLFFI